MARSLRNITNAENPPPRDEDENSIEYSFAMEYPGLAVDFAMPRALPVDIDEISTASLVATTSQINSLLLPIIQPVGKKSARVSKIGAKSIVSSSLVTPRAHLDYRGSPQIDFDSSNASKHAEADDGCLAKLSHEIRLKKSGKRKVKLEDEIELAEDESHKSFESSPNWESANSLISSSSEIFSCREEEFEDRRQLTDTFYDPKSNEIISEEESSQYQTQSFPMRPKAERKGKKGSCYRCLKGNRFTEKEICVVCGAKYCSNCVLREMGSMPEGRKCLSCIGFRIDESRRGSLGKCSKVLKRMLSPLEIRSRMKAEMESVANQLPAKLVYVNDEPLNREELSLLQSCSNPPKKLKPGSYWYDKVSGFWGKKGKEPCQIISARLNVGGCLKKDASNGNTNVFVNNREITKKELYILKMAGLPCEGSPFFWVSPDGSYVEEGMNNGTRKIWDKSKVKLVCAVLSLPIPKNPVNSGAEEVAKSGPSSFEQSMVYKLLLVGYNKSGTSTIFKQAKSLYNVPFSEEECQNIKTMIQRNLYRYIGVLLEGRERFERETAIDVRKMSRVDQLAPGESIEQAVRSIGQKTTYAFGPRLKDFSDWLLQAMVSGFLDDTIPAASRAYAPYIEDLWKDPAFQATYTRRNELELLPRVATYFLDRAVDISKIYYEPSANDILYAEGITASNGLSNMEFSFPESPQDCVVDHLYEHNPKQRYQLIRVHSSSLGENCKWLEMFDNVDIILFCVALTDYDEFQDDGFGALANKMMASKKFFESVIQNPTVKKKQFLLILNKFDLFEEKVEQVSLARCEWFDDFNPLITPNSKVSGLNGISTSLAHRAFQYIAVKFKRLFYSYTQNKLFFSLTTGMEPDSVNETLKYAREVLKWQKEESKLNSELSSMSNETTYSSYES